MQRRGVRLIMAGLAIAGAIGSAYAIDPGGKVLRITPEVEPAQRPFKMVMAVHGNFTLPGPANDPTVYGGLLRIRDLGPVPGTTVDIELPANEWNSRFTASGPKYVYRGQLGYHPCKTIALSGTRWKIRCRGFANGGAVFGNVGTPFSGVARINLYMGLNPDLASAHLICQDFGGSEARNDSGGLKRLDAPITTSCSSPSGAFTD